MPATWKYPLLLAAVAVLSAACHEGGLSDLSLRFSTYLGGGSFDWGSGVAVDANDDIYVSGGTQSKDFDQPTPLPPDQAGSSHVRGFVTKFDRAGIFVSSWLLSEASVADVALDAAGNVYVTGTTNRRHRASSSLRSPGAPAVLVLLTPVPTCS